MKKRPVQQNDTHDQLMAEFRKVHRKLFTSSTEETEEEEEVSQVMHSNRSYDETLVKPIKTLPARTVSPPQPPERTVSISPTASTASPTSSASMSTFKSSPNNNSLASNSPGIPTPDYSGSSPEPVQENNTHLVRKSELRTFNRRHPSMGNTF